MLTLIDLTKNEEKRKSRYLIDLFVNEKAMEKRKNWLKCHLYTHFKKLRKYAIKPNEFL